MKYVAMASVLTLAIYAGEFYAGSASAQVSSETTTTQSTVAQPGYVAPAPLPPEGVLSTERDTHAVDAYGNRVDSQATTYRDANGVVRDSKATQTRVVPVPPPVTTTTTTSTSTTAVPN
jgi:hypothetical protein